MKYFKYVQSLLILLILITNNATAQQSKTIDSEEQYKKYVTNLHTVYRMIGFVNEYCNQSFPSYKFQNNSAFKNWNTKNKVFHDEIESHYKNLIKINSKTYNLTINETSFKLEKLLSTELKLTLDKMNQSSDEGSFKEFCETFPKLVISPKYDLKKSFSSTIDFIRNFEIK